MRTQGGSKLDEEIGGSLSEERTQGSCTCLGASMWIAGDLVFIDKVIYLYPHAHSAYTPSVPHLQFRDALVSLSSTHRSLNFSIKLLAPSLFSAQLLNGWLHV